MNRRDVLRTAVLGSLAATAGCITLADGGDGGDVANAEPTATATPLDLPNHDLPACSDASDAIYEISAPRLKPQPDEKQVLVLFTIEYVGPNEDQYSVAPTINIVLYDEEGNQVGTLNKAETFSPTAVTDLSYAFAKAEAWKQVATFGIDILHQRSSQEAGCLVRGSS